MNKVSHACLNTKYHSRDIHIDNLEDDKSMKSINFSPDKPLELSSSKKENKYLIYGAQEPSQDPMLQSQSPSDPIS